MARYRPDGAISVTAGKNPADYGLPARVAPSWLTPIERESWYFQYDYIFQRKVEFENGLYNPKPIPDNLTTDQQRASFAEYDLAFINNIKRELNDAIAYFNRLNTQPPTPVVQPEPVVKPRYASKSGQWFDSLESVAQADAAYEAQLRYVWGDSMVPTADQVAMLEEDFARQLSEKAAAESQKAVSIAPLPFAEALYDTPATPASGRNTGDFTQSSIIATGTGSISTTSITPDKAYVLSSLYYEPTPSLAYSNLGANPTANEVQTAPKTTMIAESERVYEGHTMAPFIVTPEPRYGFLIAASVLIFLLLRKK